MNWYVKNSDGKVFGPVDEAKLLAWVKDGLEGEVHSVSVLKQVVKIIFTDENGDREAKDYKAEDLIFKARKHHEKAATPEEMKELKALEALERKEAGSHLDD